MFVTIRIISRFTLILLILALTYHAQTAEDVHSKVRSAIEERRYADALNNLTSLEKNNPDIFALNNYDYLLARTYEKAGNVAAAMARYQAVIKRNAVLKEYALFHMASITRSSGNLVLERTYLEEIIAFHPGSLLADAARNRLARSLFESGNYVLARGSFESLSSGAVPRKTAGAGADLARENRLYLARCLLLSGDLKAARENFVGLIKSLANPAQPDDFALAAVKELDKLDLPGDDRKVPALSDHEHLQRASIYQFNRDFADARLHYEAIINEHPASGIAPDAMFQTGRGYAQESNFHEAIIWFERAVEQFPHHEVSKDSLLQGAAAYARVGKLRESVKRYHDYIDKYPEDERVDRAYLNIIDVLRDEGEEIEAQKWAVKVQEVFRGKLPAAQALFAEARIMIARNKWDDALNALDKLKAMPELGGANVPGGTSKPEIAFLRAFVLEQKRDFAAAVSAYLDIPDGRADYYGSRATERLRILSEDSQAKDVVDKTSVLIRHSTSYSTDREVERKNVQSLLRLTADPKQRTALLDSLRRSYSALPAYRKLPQFKLLDTGRREIRRKDETPQRNQRRALADELIFLGLYDEGAPEYDVSLPATSAGPNDLAYTKAVLYNRGDKAYKSVTFAEPLWRNVPADYQIELIPRDMGELLYPAPYADAFDKYAIARNIDPRFLLSLVRQESRYQPDIKSYAAARGLMQFISTTADKIASELGRANFKQDELYDPSTAILFGSQYTANLFKLFPNQPAAVAASYNGGEDNMNRWMKRSKSLAVDRYVPEIAFSQSKDYVYKVMANYRVYQMLYDERLASKASF